MASGKPINAGPTSTVICPTELRRRIQLPDESVGAFVADLRRLAGDCQDADRLFRVQLASGLDDSAIRKLFEVILSKMTMPEILQLVGETETDPTTTTMCPPAAGSLLDPSPVVHNQTDDRPAVRISSTKKSRSDVGVDTLQSSNLSISIISMPPEVLATIFKMLDVKGKGRVAQVCRSWQDIAMLKAVWRDTVVCIKRKSAERLHIFSFLARRRVHKIMLKNAHRSLLVSPIMQRNMSDLTHLTLSHSKGIKNCNVLQISKSFTELVVLKLVFLRTKCLMTDAAIDYICDGLRKLKHLTLQLLHCQGITDVGIRQLATVGPPLEFLSVEGCVSLTEESLQHLSSGKLASLEGLELGHFLKITDACIGYIATMKKLRYLNLTIQNYSSNHQLKMIASMISLQKLTLSSYSGSNLEDSGMKILANGKAMIETLVLTGCYTITDNSLMYLATMPHLRQLGIFCCQKLTLEGLEHLMRGNKKLTGLDIRSCCNIGSLALECIVTNQPNLQWLNLNEQHVSEEGLVKAGQLRHLTVFEVDDKNWLPKLIV